MLMALWPTVPWPSGAKRQKGGRSYRDVCMEIELNQPTNEPSNHLVVQKTLAKGLFAWIRGTELGLEEKESYRVQVVTGANLSGKSATWRYGWLENLRRFEKVDGRGRRRS